MRITSSEQAEILRVAKHRFGDAAKVWLFGSRTDDSKLGGDIDIYIETDTSPVGVLKGRARGDLEDALNRKVDVIVNNGTRESPMFNIARDTGIRLG